MKKILQALVTLLLLTAPHNADAIDKSRLYLVGDAAPCGWNNLTCEEMTPTGDGRFTWEGHLTAGQFRFLSKTGDWGESWFAVPEGDYDYSEGGGSPLRDGMTKPITTDGTGNRLLKVTEAGDYRIVADLGRETVTLYKVRIYLIGNATSAGWEADAPVPVWPPVNGNGESSWTGCLMEGELKFLERPGSWEPCFTASRSGEAFPVNGSATITRHEGYDDKKFKVTHGGTYTITFSERLDKLRSTFRSGGRGYAFHLNPGTYLMAADMSTMQLHTAPLPGRLYIGTCGNDCQELNPVPGEPGRFSGEVTVQSGTDYHLCYKPEKFDACRLSPSGRLTLTSGMLTGNITPAADDGAYRFECSGEWELNVDFLNLAQGESTAYPSHPTMGARLIKTGISDAARADRFESPSVAVSGRTIIITGATYRTIIHTVAGTTVSTGARATVSPGVYIVMADSIVKKVIVK